MSKDFENFHNNLQFKQDVGVHQNMEETWGRRNVISYVISIKTAIKPYNIVLQSYPSAF